MIALDPQGLRILLEPLLVLVAQKLVLYGAVLCKKNAPPDIRAFMSAPLAPRFQCCKI